MTLGVLATLLYLGWRLVRLEARNVDRWGVAIALLAGGDFALGLLQGLPAVERSMLLRSLATVVGMGATMGAVRGWVAALVGSGLAAVGALFAASLLSWLCDVTPSPEAAVVPFTVQLAFYAGAAAWAYALARVILLFRRPLDERR